jgi:hypothetical protein
VFLPTLMFFTLLFQPQTPFQLLEDQKNVEQKRKKCLLSFIANNIVNILCSQWVHKVSPSSFGIDVFSLTFVCKNVQQDWNNCPPYFLNPKPLLNSWKPKKRLSEKGKNPLFLTSSFTWSELTKCTPFWPLNWIFCSKIHVVKCSMRLALTSFWLNNNIFAKNSQHFLISRNGIRLFVYANLDFVK